MTNLLPGWMPTTGTFLCRVNDLANVSMDTVTVIGADVDPADLMWVIRFSDAVVRATTACEVGGFRIRLGPLDIEMPARPVRLNPGETLTVQNLQARITTKELADAEVIDGRRQLEDYRRGQLASRQYAADVQMAQRRAEEQQDLQARAVRDQERRDAKQQLMDRYRDQFERRYPSPVVSYTPAVPATTSTGYDWGAYDFDDGQADEPEKEPEVLIVKHTRVIKLED